MGVIAGMRSMSAPALTSNYLAQQNSHRLAHSPFSLMGSPRVANVLKAAAIGELVADKLPFIPARISPVPLLFRALSGALCGASLCAADGKRAEVGAIAGGLAAIGSAYAFYHLRRKIGAAVSLPDAVLGFAEDTLVIGSGLSILSNVEAASQLAGAEPESS
jgi:uncharacterized membrane protein